MPEFDFNPRDYKPSKTSKRFPPISVGKYWVACTEAKAQPTKKSEGKILALRFRITRGEHTDRLIFDYLNVVNRSEDSAREKIHDWSELAVSPTPKALTSSWMSSALRWSTLRKPVTAMRRATTSFGPQN
jgi:hypothetical protein